MGNSRSRVAPARALQILDSETRARYQNQRELVLLRAKIRNLRIEQSDTLARLAFDRHEVKTKLRELDHERGQRDLLKKLDACTLQAISEGSQEKSVSSSTESDQSDVTDLTTSDSSSLLLHNLTTSVDWEKSNVISSKSNDLVNKAKPFDAMKTLRSQYSSRLDTNHPLFAQSESFLLDDQLSLRQHTEQMSRSVRIAVAKATRDSNIMSRRNVHRK